MYLMYNELVVIIFLKLIYGHILLLSTKEILNNRLHLIL